MCGGIAGPPMGDDDYDSSRVYYKPIRSSCDKNTGGMKKRCSCGQINLTNTKCLNCGKPNHYSKRKTK